MITVETDIELSDYRAFTKFVVRRALVTTASRTRLDLLSVALGLAVVTGPLFLGWILGFTIHFPTMVVSIVLTWVSLVLYSRMRARELAPLLNGMILGPKTVSVDEHAIRVASDRHQSLYALDCVLRVETGKEHIFVMIDRLAAIIIPRRSFNSPDQYDQFLAALKQPPAAHPRGTNSA